MTETVTTTPTQDVLAAMLVENTGRHMLDSGDAYGRNFERNAGKTAHDFIAEPVCRWGYGHDYVVVSLFHWLDSRLVLDEDLDKKFQAWLDADDSDEAWLSLADRWSEEHNTSHSTCRTVGTWNSYNEDTPFSQDFQFCQYLDENDDPVVVLSIHGGCDIRGGYTRPHIFRYIDIDDFLVEQPEIDVTCSSDSCRDAWILSPDYMAELDNHFHNGEWITDEPFDPSKHTTEVTEAYRDEQHNFVPATFVTSCPQCGSPMEPSAELSI